MSCFFNRWQIHHISILMNQYKKYWYIKINEHGQSQCVAFRKACVKIGGLKLFIAIINFPLR